MTHATKASFLEHLTLSWYNPTLVRYIPEAMPKNLSSLLPSTPETAHAPLGLSDPKSIVQYYLVLNSINHQFWSLDENGAMVRYQNNGKVGALAMHEGIEALILAKGFAPSPVLTAGDINMHFGAIPDPEQRRDILNEAFTKSGTLAETLLSEVSGGWGVMEALAISQTLPAGYKDEALKKAQLALFMSSQALGAIGLHVPVEVTVFADYQLPKVMRHLGQLEFHPELAAKIDRGELLPADGTEERAIRAATILCGEDTSARSGVSIGDLDYWYWLQRNDTAFSFHRTLTVAY